MTPTRDAGHGDRWDNRSMAGMQVWTMRRDDGLVVLGMRGTLDIDTAPVLRDAVDGLLTEPVPQIIIDLSGVTFCDSIGLGTFAYTHTSCVARGGFLRLACPTTFLMKLLDTVGLSDKVGVYESVERAASA
jgi:anti-sigma B factor antagonist